MLKNNHSGNQVVLISIFNIKPMPKNNTIQSIDPTIENMIAPSMMLPSNIGYCFSLQIGFLSVNEQGVNGL